MEFKRIIDNRQRILFESVVSSDTKTQQNETKQKKKKKKTKKKNVYAVVPHANLSIKPQLTQQQHTGHDYELACLLSESFH